MAKGTTASWGETDFPSLAQQPESSHLSALMVSLFVVPNTCTLKTAGKLVFAGSSEAKIKKAAACTHCRTSAPMQGGKTA